MRKVFLTSLLLVVVFVSLRPNNFYQSEKTMFASSTKAAEQNFRIKQKNPVVNENNRIVLTTVDKTGSNIQNGVSWQSGSPDIAQVNANTGEVLGVKTGFVTITASRAGETSSVFVAVARVRKANGGKVPGDTKTDSNGSVYISNPLQNVILKADNKLNAPLQVYTGTLKTAGNRNGKLEEALFAGPTAIGVNNSVNGGLYVADTLNHTIRKIGFNKQVETVIGKGSPGVSHFDNKAISFDNVLLNSPRGVVSDAGGNLYIADTDNHAIYYADLSKQQVFLLAGEPGQSGKDDGIGRKAKFRRPSAMALSNDGRLLTVADEDNNRVRLIDISRDSSGGVVANVSTLSVANSTQTLFSSTSAETSTEAIFEQPQSVSIDGVGNIYVVDKTGVQLITRVQGQIPQIMQLAQQEVSFNQAVSVTVKGTEAFVLDSKEVDTESLKIVSVGGPEIGSIEPAIINLGENGEIIVRGKSFAPESQVVVGGKLAQDVNVVSAEEIRFRFPAQDTPGKLTLSILTRGGLAQRPLDVVAKPVSMLATGEITTIAGGRVFTGDGGKADQSSLNFPDKTVIDGNGNLFIADQATIRRVDAQTGIITTIAGSGNSLEDGVLANTAKMSPVSIAVDKPGNLFIADDLTIADGRLGFSRVLRIRRIDSLTNIITTIAGKKDRRFSGDNGLAFQAGFDSLSDLVFDPNGNLLILEAGRIRRIDSLTNIITTIAGNGNKKFSGDNGPAKDAGFDGAIAIDADIVGNIYIAEYSSNRIRRISTNGIITTIAGNGKVSNVTTNRDGKLAHKVALNIPSSLKVASDNSLFFVDQKAVALSGVVKFLGIISCIDLNTGRINTVNIKLSNSETLTSIFSISGVSALDGLGNLFFGSFTSVYRLNLSTGVATQVVGNTKINFSESGNTIQTTSLGNTVDAAFDSNNNLYLADFANGVVRKADSITGEITTIVGADTSKTVGDGDGGQAINAVCKPFALEVDSTDNLIIADYRNFATTRLRKVNLQTGIITTIAGNGEGKDSGDDGPATKAGIGIFVDMAVDSQDNIYFITREGNLRKVSSKTGIITLLAKNFSSSTALTINTLGDILVSAAYIIHSVDIKTGKVVKFAGRPYQEQEISGDGGPLSQAGLGNITGLAIDKTGNLFITSFQFEINGNRPFFVVRRVDAQTKIINTIAGDKAVVPVTAADIGTGYKGDGDLAIKANITGNKIVIDKQGNLYIVVEDSKFNAIRLVKLS